MTGEEGFSVGLSVALKWNALWCTSGLGCTLPTDFREGARGDECRDDALEEAMEAGAEDLNRTCSRSSVWRLAVSLCSLAVSTICSMRLLGGLD